ncbi:MAG: FtsQ-type POTRA domain-containing protein [Oscillospiraceae bacterium]|nr:FtsQ-type POTRA domain-containing protein [Oscillospiraceae bacterium]
MDTKERKRPAPQSRRPASGSAATRTKTGRKAPAKRPQRKRTAKAPSVDVVYAQPTPFNKYRFLLYLASVVAVVLAIIFGMSIFFKVATVTVVGNEKYTAWDIREASGIQDGENLLSVSEARVSNSITSKLPYVNKVRVGIKLPDTVKLEIEEIDVVYSVQAADGSWWLMRSDGMLTEKVSDADAKQHTQILGVQLSNPEQGQQAAASQPEQPEGETVPVTVLASEQLQVALTITQYLEGAGVIGGAASINVEKPADLELWFGERYQVLLGDAMELGYKIRSMKSAIDQMGDYQSGVLDVSFTIWPDEVGYTPFS